MRLPLLASLLLLALTAGACRHSLELTRTGATTLRVVSYNIRAGTDMQGQPALERQAALLDSLAADIVLLQEVDRNTTRSGVVDQLAELARLTGMHGAFGRAMDFGGGEYGIGILSRLPLRDTATIALPVTIPPELTERYHEPRVLLRATVATPAGPLHLLATHLDHHGPPFFRHPQLMGILAHLGEVVPEDRMVIFGGDLNAVPEAVEIRALAIHFTDAWTACGGGEGFTFPADRPDRRIDYLLMRGATCTAASVVHSQRSDHRPLVVDLRLAPRR